jgi:hypothetical protein
MIRRGEVDHFIERLIGQDGGEKSELHGHDRCLTMSQHEYAFRRE